MVCPYVHNHRFYHILSLFVIILFKPAEKGEVVGLYPTDWESLLLPTWQVHHKSEFYQHGGYTGGSDAFLSSRAAVNRS